MANVDNANGLRPVRHLTGGEIRASHYAIASAYNTNIFTGDVVEGVADGSIEIAEGANVDNLGVFAGVKYVNASNEQVFSQYWPANTVATEIEALVYDDPNIVFRAQADTATAAAIHLLTDWDDGAGSTATGNSGRELAVSSGATTGQSLRIIGKVEEPDNAWGQYVDLEVVFQEHVMKGVVSGVGGI